jgi:hypothetical protein
MCCYQLARAASSWPKGCRRLQEALNDPEIRDEAMNTFSQSARCRNVRHCATSARFCPGG